MSNVRNISSQMMIAFEQLKTEHNKICPADRGITEIDLDLKSGKFVVKTLQSNMMVTEVLTFDSFEDVTKHLMKEINYWDNGYGSIIRLYLTVKQLESINKMMFIEDSPETKELQSNIETLKKQFSDDEKQLEEHGYNTKHKHSVQIPL